MPARVHASQFTVATPKRRSLIIKEDVLAADLCFMQALGASKKKGTGRAKHVSTHKTLNNVRVSARLKMSRSMLLERAAKADDA